MAALFALFAQLRIREGRMGCPWCDETFGRDERKRFVAHVVKLHAEDASRIGALNERPS